MVEYTSKEESIPKRNPEWVQTPQPSNSEDKPTWKLHVDESATNQLSGAGIALVTPGEYKARGEKMIAYVRKICEFLSQFKSYGLRQLPREENTTTDTCVTQEEAARLLSEVHDGFCGNHAAGQSLSKKILRHGYFWPTMIEDSKAYVKKCDTC
ncbi:uncharacterized protein LOC133036049 [Cannabis sativa]|uniref:uncharacterized protein LOC133036049 n=1 Tax=Cannabis sativa TaxID=3483 RepID=UPI0029CA5AAA|nr:uncharacterized protein LOC133036049 [Cannabis sativa]